MNKSRLRTLLIGTSLGTLYAFLTFLLVEYSHQTVSIAYVFALPLILGAIPALFSTRAQLNNYLYVLLIPCLSTLSFFYLSFLAGLEGTICLTIIIGPFLIIGCLGAFLFRLYRLKKRGDHSERLYLSLLLPFLILMLEGTVTVEDYIGTVSNTVFIEADRETVWNHLKEVRDIQESEVEDRFIHWIGVPKPLDGALQCEDIGCDRVITWGKNVHFKEVVTVWEEGEYMAYEIVINPEDIPPNTLDEHVMVGGRYFDALDGSYRIRSIDDGLQEVTLKSSYRISSTVNFYGKYWADFIFSSLHETILDVIKHRAESEQSDPIGQL